MVALESIGSAIAKATLPTVRKNLGKAVKSIGGWAVDFSDNDRLRRKATLETSLSSDEIIRTKAAQRVGEIPELIDRAAHFEFERAYRSQLNREGILEKAFKEANSRTDQDASEEIDDDWLFNFAEHASRVSNEQMQSVWARILAGEMFEPGTFSLRTLDILSKLSVNDANDVAGIAPYVVKDGWIYRRPYFIDKYQSILLRLEDIGLVKDVLTVGPPSKPFPVRSGQVSTGFVLSDNCAIALKGKTLSNVSTVSISLILCSREMQELVRVSGIGFSPDEQMEIVRHLSSQGVIVQYGPYKMTGKSTFNFATYVEY